MDEGVRPGEVDENGEIVTWDGVYHHKIYVKPLGMIGVYVDDISGVGLAKAVGEAMEKMRLLWKTTPVEALSEHKELAFLGTWVSEKLLVKGMWILYLLLLQGVPPAELAGFCAWVVMP